MALLNKAEILAHRALKRHTVIVPEWGGDVLVQELTGTQRDAIEAEMTNARQKAERNAITGELLTGFRLRVLRYSLIDAEGAMLFNVEDIEGLANQSGQVLSTLFEAAMQLNGMKKADIEELTKN